MASQKDSHKDSQGNQSKQNDQKNSRSASSRGAPGNAQAARSEEQLDQEERSLIGQTAEDHNLTGSTTYVTLPDQKGDKSQESKTGRRDSYGGSHGDTTR